MASRTAPLVCHARQEELNQSDNDVQDEESEPDDNPSLKQTNAYAARLCKDVHEKIFNNSKQAFHGEKSSFTQDLQKPEATQDIQAFRYLSKVGAENNLLNKDAANHPVLPGRLLLAATKSGDLKTIDFLLQQQREGRKHMLSHDHLNASLLEACRAGRKFIVQKLVRSGANVNAERHKTCTTPLHIAAQQGFVDIADFLLSKGADVNAVDPESNTALILAVNQAGSCDMLNLLLAHEAELHYQNSKGMTALMKAVEVMDIDAVKLLMLAKASSDTKNKNGKAARDIAATLGIVDVYDSLQSESQEHRYYSNNSEALTTAVLKSQTEAVKILLDCRALEIKTKHTQKEIEENKKAKICTALMELIKSICSDADEEKKLDDRKLEVTKALMASGIDAEIDRPSRYACFPSFNEALCAATRSGVYELIKLLLEVKSIQNNRWIYEDSALMIASRIGRLDIVKLLLAFGADPGLKNYKNEKALTHALMGGQIECAQFLIERHKPSESELQKMCRQVIDKGQLGSLKFLAQHVDLSGISQSLMEAAVLTCDTKVVQCLIDHGADINTTDGFRRPALLIALRNRDANNLLYMVRFLVEMGAHVNRTPPHDSPLVTAVKYNGNLDVLRYLLDQSADVNEVGNDDDETPLLVAFSDYLPLSGNSLSEILEVLLEAQADPNKSTPYGDTPLHRAVYKGGLGIVKQLIDAGADLEARDSNGRTPFLQAAKDVKHGVIKLLTNCGANTKAVDDNGSNGLVLSLMHHHHADEETWRFLSSDKDQVNIRTRDGLTPLIVAAMFSHHKAINILLESGGDPHVCNDEQQTALSILLKSSDFRSGSRDAMSSVKLLISRGALHSLPKRHCYMLYSKIMSDERELAQLLVTHGMAPICVDFKETTPPERLNNISDLVLRNFSPLAAALVRERLEIARYLLENWFLTTADVVGSVHMQAIRGSLSTSAQAFLDEHFSQPMPLVQLSYVAVSAQLGEMIGREERVRKLPLPIVLQDKLLFKKEVYPMDFTGVDESRPSQELNRLEQFLLLRLMANNFLSSSLRRSYYDDEDDDDYDYYY
ncbi:ankyrin homolog [Elysia marginata]|uniref:Ankyrin homolog n=1 Tax=Elysia marginata TaxID=1093978 RepID=A0AAV4J5H9_9GAST|nr:ankyrin homolog [Elysia marginata]